MSNCTWQRDTIHILCHAATRFSRSYQPEARQSSLQCTQPDHLHDTLCNMFVGRRGKDENITQPCTHIDSPHIAVHICCQNQCHTHEHNLGRRCCKEGIRADKFMEITLQDEKQLDSTGECIPRICRHNGIAIIARSQHILEGIQGCQPAFRRFATASFDRENSSILLLRQQSTDVVMNSIA